MIPNLDIKKIVFFLLLICNGTTHAQFLGGAADGFARVNLNGSCAVVAFSPFSGGDSDGYNSSRSSDAVCNVIAPTPFTGGKADGFANTRIGNSNCEFIALSPFSGGFSDGYSSSKIDSFSCFVIAPTPFTGGIADGFVNTRIGNSNCEFIALSPFSGGISDGYSNSKVDPVSCPVIAPTPFAGGKADGFSKFSYIRVNPNTCDPVALPIQLLSFDAIPEENKVLTKWSTATERNNDYFTVERTIDGIAWIEIGQVKGAGNSNYKLDYQLYDLHPVIGTQYYKLKQTDYDGRFSYSDVRSATFFRDGNQNITVYPNPSKGKFTVQVHGEQLEQATIKLFDLAGHFIWKEENFSGKEFHFDMSDHPSGMYLLEIETASKTQRIKLVKQL